MSATLFSGAMPTLRNMIEFFDIHGRMPFPIMGGDGTDGDNGNDGKPPTDPDAALGLGDAGKAALKQEREARAAAEKAAKEAASELDTLRKEKAEAAAAKAAADEEDAKRKGEFQTLAEKRAEELKAAMADKETTAKELERATRHLQSVIDARFKELEATEDKDLIAGFPKDKPLLDQIEWLDDPRTKAAMRVAATAKADAEAQKKRVPGGVTPRPNAGKEPSTEHQERVRRNHARAYTG